MNLAVSECPVLGKLIREVIDAHGDHGSFFFFDIHVFDQALFAAFFEVPHCVSDGRFLLEISQYLLDVRLGDFELVARAVDDEERRKFLDFTAEDLIQPPLANGDPPWS